MHPVGASIAMPAVIPNVRADNEKQKKRRKKKERAFGFEINSRRATNDPGQVKNNRVELILALLLNTLAFVSLISIFFLHVGNIFPLKIQSLSLSFSFAAPPH